MDKNVLVSIKKQRRKKWAKPIELLENIKSYDLVFVMGEDIEKITDFIQEHFGYVNTVPEQYNHPKKQIEIGRCLFRPCLEQLVRKPYIVITHSDYIVDGFRYMLGKSDKKIKSCVLFFYKNKKCIIDILDSGNYSEKQPKEFRQWSIDYIEMMMEI